MTNFIAGIKFADLWSKKKKHKHLHTRKKLSPPYGIDITEISFDIKSDAME